jgi:glycosyltransferase involved in cell wall biosynthesis
VSVSPDRPTVLIVCDFYLPGHKGGGPIRSLANLVSRMGDEIDFLVVTRDRDLGDRNPYPDVIPARWTAVGKARVMYLAKLGFSAELREVLQNAKYNILYLNSFFSRRTSMPILLLRWVGAIPARPLILAPRGEFSAGALALNPIRKRAYLRASKALGLLKDVFWQASTDHEKVDLINALGAEHPDVSQGDTETGVRQEGGRIFTAADLPELPTGGTSNGESSKVAGGARIAFLGRISPMKNLHAAIELLGDLDGRVQLNIFGPLEDPTYWERCERAIRQLPPNINVEYRGEIAHSEVAATLGAHDLLFLPTLGENYGHVILEALVAGTPVLISDRTPWRGLEGAGVGWDIPLQQPGEIRRVLAEVVAMDAAVHAKWSSRARTFGREHASDTSSIQAHQQIFAAAIGGASRRASLESPPCAR